MLIFLLIMTQETIPDIVSMWVLNLSSYYKANLVRIKDEKLDGIEDREDASQKGEHLVIQFILVLLEYIWLPFQRTPAQHFPRLHSPHW